jgi:Zn-dependent protease
MNNSWNLGSVSGINLRVHWTFLLLPAWIYFSSISAGSGVVTAAISVLFLLAVFGCVVLHEFGHAMAARQFGIGTRDITLLPIGGVASLERMPRNPLQELWIAVAGPLVNIVIATAILMGLAINPTTGSTVLSQFFGQLMLANVVLVVFNMIPAFPMDGGRVLRSILAMFMDYAQATNVAASVGQVCAIGLGLLGLFSGNFMLLFVAGFVYLAAKAESMQVANEASGVRFEGHGNRFASDLRRDNRQVDGGGLRDDAAVPASLSVSSVAAWLGSERRDRCAVVESGQVIGEISKSQLIAAIYRGLGRIPVGQLMAS